jgi:hypothetical protein
MSETASEEGPSALDYFASGVPAVTVLAGSLEDLITLLNQDYGNTSQRRLYELCFVGAVSYFEAFCKDHFASILNIAPQLISKLSQAGIETRVDPMQILEARDGLRTQIGFLVTERMDMGTADQINKLYGHILKITPFSKDNRLRFASILHDRNLLVHHGGTYTSAYIKQSGLLLSSDRSRAFFDSKVVTRDDVLELVRFLQGIAITTAKRSKSALKELITDVDDISPSVKQALEYLDFMPE